MKWRTHDHTVLVLQGGGALGACQAGVFEGLLEAGAAPDWIAGVSLKAPGRGVKNPGTPNARSRSWSTSG